MSIEDAFSKETLFQYYKDRIRDNSGKGIDGVSVSTFEFSIDNTLDNINKKIFSKKYRFSPYLEIIKSKGRGKEPRLISKPTVRDKIVLFAIKEKLYNDFPECVPKMLPNNYIREIVGKLSGLNVDEYSYLKIDIKRFYDSLDRDLIYKLIKDRNGSEEFITLLRRAIINKTVPKVYKKKEAFKYRNEIGVPQGLSISNIIAEIYMSDFDKYFLSKTFAYFRYVDDILIIAKNNEISSLERKVDEKLSKIHLSSHEYDQERKCEKGSVSNKFQYLGYELNSSEISVKESTVIRYIESIIAMFTRFKHNAERLEKDSKFLNLNQIKEIFVLKLNEKITGAISENKKYGWIFYFSEINDLPLLYKIDAIIEFQFGRLNVFDNKVPSRKNVNNPDGLCSLVRSYYEIKFNVLGGYIHNYNSYEDRKGKLSYLVKFGYIAHYDEASYTDEEINKMFIAAKKSSLLKLELDIGSIS